MPGFCVMIEGQEGVGWDAWCTLAETAERLGFDGLFTSDHYGSAIGIDGRDALDAWAVLTALAGRTARLRLGTLVSPVTFRPPAVVAKLALTADHVSGGRVELGLGAGWNEREHAAHGFPFPPLGERLELLEEQTEIVRRLLDGEELTFSGARYAIERGRLLPAPRQARLPIVIGGAARPRTARLAARFADEYNLVFAPPADCAAARTRLDRACAEAGRDPATLPSSLMTRCVVGRDARELRARLRRVGERSNEDGEAAFREEGGGWIAGTPAQALERIAEYRAAGVSRFFLQHLDHEDADMLELLAEEVLPAARAASGA
jgi:F420-dependent oxidoreductase-like protein